MCEVSVRVCEKIKLFCGFGLVERMTNITTRSMTDVSYML